MAMKPGDIYVVNNQNMADYVRSFMMDQGRENPVIVIPPYASIESVRNLRCMEGKIHVDHEVWAHLPPHLTDELRSITDMITGPDCTMTDEERRKSAADKLALAIGYAVNDPSGGKVLLPLDDAQEILRALRSA